MENEELFFFPVFCVFVFFCDYVKDLAEVTPNNNNKKKQEGLGRDLSTFKREQEKENK